MTKKIETKRVYNVLSLILIKHNNERIYNKLSRDYQMIDVYGTRYFRLL